MINVGFAVFSLTVIPHPHFLPGVNGTVQHAEIERKAADEQATLRILQLLTQLLLPMKPHQQHDVHRALREHSHHVGLRIDRVLHSGRLQRVAVVPLAWRKVRSKALLSGRFSVAECTETLVGVLDSLESDDHIGSLVADSRQFRSDILLELGVMGRIHRYVVPVGSLDAVRWERSSVGSEGAVVNGVAVLRCDNRCLLFRKEVDQLQNGGNDLTSILPITFCS